MPVENSGLHARTLYVSLKLGEAKMAFTSIKEAEFAKHIHDISVNAVKMSTFNLLYLTVPVQRSDKSHCLI